ncbi:hypothetical protein GP2143_15871 [marine gamma proteobacterium HTCC2143]|uniref:Uncharacterized protein n=1 Tax=marine gamma proteobacterium HTCC2143 TaxID=247633 RepID=A0Y9E4_9GAMM|nr:hypothetical protein GP2143_15871 [marine gamma proteobacterium HTCC2143]
MFASSQTYPRWIYSVDYPEEWLVVEYKEGLSGRSQTKAIACQPLWRSVQRALLGSK